MSACDAAWRRFSAIVANDFSEEELTLVPLDTLRSLFRHYKVENPVEVARIEVQWKILQANQDYATKSVAQKQYNALGSAVRRTPSPVRAQKSSPNSLKSPTRAMASSSPSSSYTPKQQQQPAKRQSTPTNSNGVTSVSSIIPSPVRPNLNAVNVPFFVPGSPSAQHRATRGHVRQEKVASCDPNDAGTPRARSPGSGKRVSMSPARSGPTTPRASKHFPIEHPNSTSNPNEKSVVSNRVPHPDDTRRLRQISEPSWDDRPGTPSRLSKVFSPRTAVPANPNVPEKVNSQQACGIRTTQAVTSGGSNPNQGNSDQKVKPKGLKPLPLPESAVLPGWGSPRPQSSGRKHNKPKDMGIF